ncbi:hypothetical protein BB560_003422 [Smittium megazygosporum]|uniref:Uncharacterized protein n=1 Tax=Smittium megazygosporum TaxID=133381 RepID=A0A2T9ZC31_9FUNG|nr:hypothetical protein BB560_003422 [Smittium megazygosporum]
MGNAHPKRSDSMFDGGFFVPQGIYSEAENDLDIKILEKLIRERKIAPFYKGAAEPEEPGFDFQNHIPPLPKMPAHINLNSGIEFSSHQSDSETTNHPSSPTSTKSTMQLTNPNVNAHKSGIPENLVSTLSRLEIDPGRQSGNSSIRPNSNFPKLSGSPNITNAYSPTSLRSAPIIPKSHTSSQVSNTTHSNLLLKTLECPYCMRPEIKIEYNPHLCLMQFRKKKAKERHGKSVSHGPSQIDMFNLRSHKRSFSDAHSLATPNLISPDDIRPKLLQQIEREKTRKQEQIRQRELVIASIARIAERYSATPNTTESTESPANASTLGPTRRENAANRPRAATGPRHIETTLQSTPEGRQLFREFLRTGGESLEEFLIQEAIAQSREEFRNQTLTPLIETNNSEDTQETRGGKNLSKDSRIVPDSESSFGHSLKSIPDLHDQNRIVVTSGGKVKSIIATEVVRKLYNEFLEQGGGTLENFVVDQVATLSQEESKLFQKNSMTVVAESEEDRPQWYLEISNTLTTAQNPASASASASARS